MKTLSQADFARHRGVSKKTVTIWKQRGLLVLTDAGAVDVVATEARLAERPESYRGGSVTQTGNSAAPPVTPEPQAVSALPADTVEPLPADPSTWTTAQSLRAKEQALAQRQRRLEAEAAGRLVEIEAVGLLIEEDFGVIRSRLLAIPGKVAANLVGLSVEQIIAALMDEITEVLDELHDPAGFAERSRGPRGASAASASSA